MNINEMNMEEVEARLAEIESEVETRSGEELDSLKAEVIELQQRKADLVEHEERMQQAKDLEERKVEPEKIIETREVVKENKMSIIEERAQNLVDSGKLSIESRQLLAAGTLTPTAVKQDIAPLPKVVSSIVDDINAIVVNGIGSYAFAYQSGDAASVAVTDGNAISGSTGATFAQGSISPETWGVLDSISRLVSKETPLDYMGAIQNAAYLALRRTAKSKIVAAVLADAAKSTGKMTENKAITIDKDFVRNLVLGFNADESVAMGTKLYLCKEDLASIGAVRGTNEKKALFEITFDDENNGKIVEGGMVVNFSICSDLKNAAGTSSTKHNVMIYGQPKAITMPLWGQYEISTDEGGKYFDANLIGIRGLQTAGVGITALKAIQTINY